MSSSKTRYFLLLLGIVVWTSTTSCELVGSRTPENGSQVDDSESQTEKGGKKVLSKEEIVAAANRAARQRGLNLAKYDVCYDEGNAGWRYLVTRLSPPIFDEHGRSVWPEEAFEANLRKWWPKLESHDYQAVYYGFRPPAGDRGIYGMTWILIDRNTGKVLVAHEEPG